MILETIATEEVAPIDYCNRAIALKGDIETRFLVLGEMLLKIRDKELYSPAWTSFSEFLAEMKWNDSHASRLITVYEYFITNLQVSPEKLVRAGGWANAYELYSVARLKPAPKDFVEGFLDNMGVWNRSDMQKSIRELRSGVDMTTCAHDFQEIHLRQCTKCQLKEKIYEN